MSTIKYRLDFNEAGEVPNSRIFLFADSAGGKVNVRKGEYYAVIANSPEEVGIVVSDEFSFSLLRAERDLKIGRAGGNYGIAVCFV